MDIYIDTANLDEIKQAASMGVLDGVTTNPSLVAKEGVDFHTRLEEICAVVDGPVSAEVVALEHDAMLLEAEPLIQIAPNITIKLPCIEEGIRACKSLSDRGVNVNMTLCFQPLQALLAAKAGAFLISPFVGRVDDVGGDGMEIVQQIRQIYDNFGYKTKILTASVRHSQHLLQAAMLGSDVATCPFKVIQKMLKHPLTDVGLKQFLDDWAKGQAAMKQPAMV